LAAARNPREKVLKFTFKNSKKSKSNMYIIMTAQFKIPCTTHTYITFRYCSNNNASQFGQHVQIMNQ